MDRCISPIAVFVPVATTIACALPLTTVVPYQKREKIASAVIVGQMPVGLRKDAYREQNVSLVLFHSALIFDRHSRFVDAFALASEDGLVYTETAG